MKGDFERRSSELEKANAIELKALAEKRNTGTISEREYGVEREKILKNTAKFLLLAQLDFAEQNLKILKQGGQDVVKQEEEVAKLRQKISEDFTKKKSPISDKQKEQAGELNAELVKFKEYFDAAESIINSALDASFTNQKNKIQELIDANEEKKNKEIAAVEASTLSEQQKADRISVINTKAASEKERLELKQRQLDQKRAQYEKASKIAQIILNGALGVTAQVATGNLAGAIIAGVLAAAQLAIAIATPIPKFKRGTKDAPGGAAILGDGFVPEVVEEPSGKMWVTADTPTVYDVPKHSVIYPSVDEAKRATGRMNVRHLQTQPAASLQGYIEMKEVVKELKSVRSAIDRKPVPRVQNNMNGVKIVWGNKNSFWEWTQRNMQ